MVVDESKGCGEAIHGLSGTSLGRCLGDWSDGRDVGADLELLLETAGSVGLQGTHAVDPQ